MRLAPLLLLVPALALAQGEAAETPAPAAPAGDVAQGEATGTPAPAAPAGGLPRFGLMFDAGLPDGAVVSAVYRPVDPLRFSLGGAYNVAGFGIRGGVGWTPVRWLVSPTLNVEAGRYFEADLTWIVDESSGVPEEVRPLLERVGYSYASAQIGFELGSPSGLSLNVRVGLSYFWTTIHGASQSIDAAGGTNAVVSVSDPRLRATLPSFKVGLLYYF